MYRFPLTNIVLNKQDKKLIESINAIHATRHEPREVQTEMSKLDQNHIIDLYKRFYLKEYDGIFYNPNITDEITYILCLDKKDIYIEIPFYIDEEGNKYEFHSDTHLLKRIIKYDNKIVRYMYDKRGKLISVITDNHHYQFIHHPDYTEKYDKNNPKGTRTVEPPMKDILYDKQFFIDKENIKPYYVEDHKVTKLINFFIKQNMVKEQIVKILLSQKVLMITIPAFEKNNLLETLENMKIIYKRISIETNEYKCRYCNKMFNYKINRKKIRCPHCNFINIVKK